MKARTYPVVCVNPVCGNLIISNHNFRRGYCRSCDHWLKKFGTMRPANPFQREPVPCVECNKMMPPGESRKGLCSTCAGRHYTRVRAIAREAERQANAARLEAQRKADAANKVQRVIRRLKHIDIDMTKHHPVIRHIPAWRPCPRCQGQMLTSETNPNLIVMACLTCGEQAYIQLEA